MKKIYELQRVLFNIDKSEGEYYSEFLTTTSFNAGIIKLRMGQIDNQSSHPVDEIYYVIEGKGLISISGTDHEIRKGAIFFVPADSDHRFHGNRGDLIILYILARD
jgi:mannose-6-phosphate isomerase-like protein (cupin superfamily)